MAEKIDILRLTEGQVLNLAGHARGLAARSAFEVDDLDGTLEPVDVIFPEDFRQVSSSFFQGMFSASVRHFGSIENFFDHYRFFAPAHVRSKLVEYADQVLSR